MTHNTPYLLGIDGGGTKTIALLATSDEVPLGRGEAGPGNPRAVGFERALTNIDTAIAAAFVSAGVTRTSVASACFGLAGAGRPSEQQQIREWAMQHHIADRIHVCGDAEPVLAAGSPDHWGIALICGTGSLAWGRNAAGETARTGGWGYLLGDEGSAYAIALAGLRAAVRAADGRGPATELLPRLQDHFAATAPAQLIERLYAAETTRDQIAAAAIVVFEAARRDPLAQQIIAAAANDLAEMVTTLSRQLQLPTTSYPLAITGSVLVRQDSLRLALLDRLTTAGVSPQMQIVTDPVIGAVKLARRAIKDQK